MFACIPCLWLYACYRILKTQRAQIVDDVFGDGLSISVRQLMLTEARAGGPHAGDQC